MSSFPTDLIGLSIKSSVNDFRIRPADRKPSKSQRDLKNKISLSFSQAGKVWYFIFCSEIKTNRKIIHVIHNFLRYIKKKRYRQFY